MVTRYPHTGIVTILAVTITAGEYASSTSSTKSIEGRIENTSQPKRVKNAAGDWIEVRSRFFTRHRKITNADSITVNGKAYKIIDWVEYQTSCEIWLD